MKTLFAKMKKIKKDPTESNTDYVRRLCEAEVPTRKKKGKK